MSRIIGSCGEAGGIRGESSLRAGLERMRGQGTGAQRTLSAGSAHLGWCGRETPNVSAQTDLVVTMDGRIFNSAEFGEFTTDAALFAAAYEKFGFEETLRRINGVFSVALFDRRTQTLWLGRDRFGVKPLYYSCAGETITFASRPAGLLALPWISREPSRRFVAVFAGSHYRMFDNDPESSPYAQLKQVPAAHALEFAQGHARVRSYWQLKDLPEWTESEDELAARYRDLLVDAVRIRVRRADRPAFTLSGGMDSSSVLACAVSVTGEKQEAVSTVYVDKTYDESDEIRTMLDAKVRQWHRVEIDIPDVFSLVREMVDLHDEPIATSTWLSHFLLCRDVLARGKGALFGGLGGDELNAGEYEYFILHFADLEAAGDRRSLEREIECWVRHHDHPIFKKSPEVAEAGLRRLVDLSRPGVCLPDAARLGRYVSALNRDYFSLDDARPVMDCIFTSYLKNRTYHDLYRETLPCCLRADDRNSAYFGLQTNHPFLDHRLVEFMFRVPGTMKIRDGVTKQLLRSAMRGVLPEETRTRIKKTGWNAPAHIWFSGAGREKLMDLVHSQPFRSRGIYDQKEVLRLISEHEDIVASGRPVDNHMMILWQLVNLELWLQSLDA